MTCPICDKKPANCDCTDTERRQYSEISDMETLVDSLYAKIESMKLTPEEREAIEQACDEGRWFPRDYHHIHTLLALLERTKGNVTPFRTLLALLERTKGNVTPSPVADDARQGAAGVGGEAMSIQSRATRPTSLGDFGRVGAVPELVRVLVLSPPSREQHVLRMLIRRPYEGLRLPHELQWALPLVGVAESRQAVIARHPFLYLTVRNGVVASVGDDKWHVDGFSMQYHHLPEQNYTWTDYAGTEYYDGPCEIPGDFDPFRHNLHSYIQTQVNPAKVRRTLPYHAYVMDPYVIHRRPPETSGRRRCFVRLSYTPIEIADRNNTPNPLLPTNYTRDGVKDFRDTLARYGEEARA